MTDDNDLKIWQWTLIYVGFGILVLAFVTCNMLYNYEKARVWVDMYWPAAGALIRSLMQ